MGLPEAGSARGWRTRGGTAKFSPSVQLDRGCFYAAANHDGEAAGYPVCLFGRCIVQHRRPLHQGDPLERLVVGGYIYFSRHGLRFNRWIALGAISVCGTNVLFSLANKLTTAANTIVLQFTAPIFVILLSAVFWRKKPQKLDLAACVLVLAGAVCFFVDSLEMGGMLGNLLALVSGVSYAGVFLLNDLPDSDPISSVFWGDVLSVLLGFPFLIQETEFTALALTSVAILGAFQVGLAYVLMCIGLKTTAPVTASLISGIEPILNPLLVALFYQETVGPMAVVGAVIVIAGVVGYNVIKSRRPERTQNQQM